MRYQSEKDIEIKCIDCSEPFWWTERDQEFYKEKGLSKPKRCKNCRAIKKQQRGNQ
jgi:hypothetical protein